MARVSPAARSGVTPGPTRRVVRARRRYAEPSAGDVPVPTSSISTSAAPPPLRWRAASPTRAEGRDRIRSCESPMSTSTASNHGRRHLGGDEEPRATSKTRDRRFQGRFSPVFGPVMTTARVVSGTNTSTGTGPERAARPRRTPRGRAIPSARRGEVRRPQNRLGPRRLVFLRRRRCALCCARPPAPPARADANPRARSEVPCPRDTPTVVVFFVRIVDAGALPAPGASVGNTPRAPRLARSAASFSASVTSARDATLKSIPGGATNSGRHALSAMACPPWRR